MFFRLIIILTEHTHTAISCFGRHSRQNDIIKGQPFPVALGSLFQIQLPVPLLDSGTLKLVISFQNALINCDSSWLTANRLTG